jgi:hypothetical protein
MARSALQSDFSVAREPEVVLPASAAPVALPEARVITAQASALATRVTMWATVILLAALALLLAIGPHIPSGE